MTAILRSHRLSELVSARLARVVDDEVAGIVLGPRLRDLCAALGIAPADWMQLLHWADRRGDSRELEAFGTYIDVLVADRCRRPGDDLISDLVAFEVDGGGLTADDIRTIVVELVSSRTV